MARLVRPDQPADTGDTAAWLEEHRRRHRADLEPAWRALHGAWADEARGLRTGGRWRQYDQRLRERAEVGLPTHDVLHEGSPPPGGWSYDMLTVPSRVEAERMLAEAREGRPPPVAPPPTDVVPMSGHHQRIAVVDHD